LTSNDARNLPVELHLGGAAGMVDLVGHLDLVHSVSNPGPSLGIAQTLCKQQDLILRFEATMPGEAPAQREMLDAISS